MKLFGLKHLSLLFTLSLFVFCVTSCRGNLKTKRANRQVKIDSTQIIAKAEILQRILLQDTIDLEKVQECIDKGVDLNYPVPFIHSYYRSRWKKNSLMDIIFGENKNDRYEFTALQATLFDERENCFEAMMLLLKAGADPNKITKDSVRCLDRVIQRSMQNKYIDSLIKYGADPKLINLDFAYNDFREIDRFIAMGASPKTININNFLYVDHWGNYQKGSWRANFRHVLTYDIDPQKTDPQKIDDDYGGYSFNKYALDKLIEKGLDLNKPMPKIKFKYWLHWAIAWGHNDQLTKYLIDRGARTCADGIHPYDLAVEKKLNQSTIDYIEKHIGK